MDSDGGVAYGVEELDFCVTEVEDDVEGEFVWPLPESVDEAIEAKANDMVEVVAYPSRIAPCIDNAPATGFAMEDFK